MARSLTSNSNGAGSIGEDKAKSQEETNPGDR
jgi:hypothetical protein